MLKKTVNELNACLESIERIEQKLAHRLHFYDSITARQQRVTMRRAILFRTISDVVGGIVAQFPLYTVSMLLEVRAISYVIGMQSSNIVSMGQFSSAPHNSESVDFSSSSTSYLSVAKKTIVNVYAKIIAYGVRPIGAFIYSEYLCLNGALRYMGNQPIVNPGGYTPLHESDPNKLSDLMNAPHLTDIGLIWHGFRAKILSPLIPLFTGCLFEYKRLIINRVLLTEWRLDRHEKLINEEEQKEIMSEANENHDPPIPRS